MQNLRTGLEPTSFSIRIFTLAACIAGSLLGLSCTKDESVAPVQVVETGKAPEILQTTVTVLSPKTARVTGLVRANDRTTICLVEYGMSASYGQHSKDIGLPADTIARVVTDTITNLTSGMVLFFRVRATSLAGTATGPDTPVTMPPEMVQFDFALTVGTVWTYAYSLDWHNRDTERSTIRGTHTWRLLSADTSVSPHTYGFVASISNSIAYSRRDGATGLWVDTVYVSNADVPFTGTVTSDRITIPWSSTVYNAPRVVDSLARYVVEGTNTLRLKGVYGGAVNYDALYERGRGLVSFTSSLGAMSGTYTQSLTLRSMVKP